MNWFNLAIEGGKLILAIIQAFQTNGDEAANMRLKDILPPKLLTTLAREAAERNARERFRTGH
jgi:hypothetical protein